MLKVIDILLFIFLTNTLVAIVISLRKNKFTMKMEVYIFSSLAVAIIVGIIEAILNGSPLVWGTMVTLALLWMVYFYDKRNSKDNKNSQSSMDN